MFITYKGNALHPGESGTDSLVSYKVHNKFDYCFNYSHYYIENMLWIFYMYKFYTYLEKQNACSVDTGSEVYEYKNLLEINVINPVGLISHK